MANTGPAPGPSTSAAHPNLISTHRALIATLASFLTVTTHQILYLRRIYPAASFLTTRAYNFPVHQNRHPAVIAWINDAIASITIELSKNTISLLSLCIHELDTNAVLERWSFDLHAIPTVDKRDRDVPFASPTEQSLEQDSTDLPLPHTINLTDLEATFRATLTRLSNTSSRLSPLPSGPGAPELTFTMAIELRANADRPVGRLDAAERRWIVAEGDSPASSAGAQDSSATAATVAVPNSTGKTHPIRRLDASPLHIELWVEESAAKLKNSAASVSASLPNTSGALTTRSAATRAAEMSFGSGKEKYFDPNVGYDDDLEGTDLNRKPGGGSMTDYQRM